MSKTVSIDELASAVMQELEEYNDLAVEEVKKAAQEAGKQAAEEIKGAAPVKSSRYAKSWKSKVTKESATSVQVTVYSPKRYMLAHLLEHGHANRGCGRTRAIVHIKPAEENAIEKFESDIRRALEK